MVRFYSCRCFYEQNIFLKKFKTHFSYKNEKQFRNDYRTFLEKLESPEEENTLIQEIQNEILRRKQLEVKSLERRELISRLYKPLYPSIYGLKREFLSQEFLNLAQLLKDSAKKDEVLSKLDVISNEKKLYGFPMFTKAFCEDMVSEIEHFESSPVPKGRPNSMNKYGTLLEELGLYESFLDPLRIQYLNPLAKLLFPKWCGEFLDSHRAFTVSYKLGKDVELDCHYDNAEVTINVCLGKNFSGGELYFYDMKGINMDDSTITVIPHKVGYAILHRGQHLHGTMPISTGERHNMIIWMRTSTVRNKLCPMCNCLPDLTPSAGYGDGFTVL